jgi:hypothetical protein
MSIFDGSAEAEMDNFTRDQAAATLRSAMNAAALCGS